MFLYFVIGKAETNDFCGISADNCVRGDAFRNNGTGSDHSSTSDCHAFQYSDITANPNVIFNAHGQVVVFSLFVIIKHEDAHITEVVIATHNGYAGPEYDFVSNFNMSDAGKKSMWPYVNVVAYGYVAIGKRRVQRTEMYISSAFCKGFFYEERDDFITPPR